jgi:UDP-N-acetylmuramyl pentapeptide synthase
MVEWKGELVETTVSNSNFWLENGTRKISLQVQLSSQITIQNLALALAICHSLDFNVFNLQTSFAGILTSLILPEHSLRTFQLNEALVIDNSYATNLAQIANGISLLSGESIVEERIKKPIIILDAVCFSSIKDKNKVLDILQHLVSLKPDFVVLLGTKKTTIAVEHILIAQNYNAYNILTLHKNTLQSIKVRIRKQLLLPSQVLLLSGPRSQELFASIL